MTLACRPGCGACCIAPSISSPIPGQGAARGSGSAAAKPAGVRCVQLDQNGLCRLFGDPRRPAVCGQLQPSAEMCGADARAALAWLTRLEDLTAPPRD